MKNKNNKFFVKIDTFNAGQTYTRVSIHQALSLSEATGDALSDVFRSDPENIELDLTYRELTYLDAKVGEYHRVIETVRLTESEYETLAKFI